WSRFVHFHLGAGLVLAHSPLNFSRRSFRAARPCIFSVSRSKTGRSSARNVNQAQRIQNKINQPGCSRGDRNGCKNVVPAKSRTIARVRTTNIVQRRAEGSRIRPRAECSAKETIRKCGCLGRASMISFCLLRRRPQSVFRYRFSVAKFPITFIDIYGHFDPSSSYAGTSNAIRFRLCATARDRGGCEKQSIRFTS